MHEFALTSDDPEELTLRQSRLLGSADAVLCDAAVPQAILNRSRADAMRLELGKDALPSQGLIVILKSSKAK